MHITGQGAHNQLVGVSELEHLLHGVVAAGLIGNVDQTLPLPLGVHATPAVKVLFDPRLVLASNRKREEGRGGEAHMAAGA